MNSSRFATDGNGSLRVVWEDGERVLYRGSRPNGHGEQRAALIVLPAGERPSPASLDRLNHEYELKDELDGAWAARPSELVRENGRTMLVFGYGLTDAPTAVESYDVLHLAGDLVGLVNALGEQQAVLIGHDWGSIAAATTALLRPDMVRALGLLSVPYLPRRPIRPSALFHMATRERHFYQDYFQQPDHVERELEEDLRRTFLGLLYTLSGEAGIKHSSDGFPKVIVGFDKNTRFVDNIVMPEDLPSWLSEADLSFMVEEFRRSGFRGPINWYRNIDRNWEITPFLNGAKILQPTPFLAGALDVALNILVDDFESLEVNVPKLWKKHLIP